MQTGGQVCAITEMIAKLSEDADRLAPKRFGRTTRKLTGEPE